MFFKPLQNMANFVKSKLRERFPRLNEYLKYKIYKYFTVGRYCTAIVGRKKVRKYVRTTSELDFLEQYGYKPTRANLLRDERFYRRYNVPIAEMLSIKGTEKRPIFYYKKTYELDQGDTETMFTEMVDIAYPMVKAGYHFDIMPKNFGLNSGKLVFRDTFGIRKRGPLKEELEPMIRKIVRFDRLVFNVTSRKKKRFEKRVRAYVYEKFKDELEVERNGGNEGDGDGNG